MAAIFGYLSDVVHFVAPIPAWLLDHPAVGGAGLLVVVALGVAARLLSPVED